MSRSGSTSCRSANTRRLRATYERMLEKGAERFQVKPSGLPAMEHLYDELPNFTDVLDDVKRQLALCHDSRDALEITPMLLLGPPGIGKTHFARQVAQLLGTGLGFISMSSLTAGWVLSGASSQWKGARPGKVFETLVDGQYANPVMVVDEIDKARGEHAYDPLGALYSLLEHDTGAGLHRRVRRSADRRQPGDLGGHRQRRTRDPRAHPQPHERVRGAGARPRRGALIALRLYRQIRGQHDWGRQFEPEPPKPCSSAARKLAPREMRRAWMTAFGNARLDHRGTVEVRDLPDCPVQRRSPIGFTH
jgi:ATP-dependent Lon protease